MAKSKEIRISIGWVQAIDLFLIVVAVCCCLYLVGNIYTRGCRYEEKIDRRIETRDLVLKSTLINPIEISPKDSTEISRLYASELLERMQKLEESQSEYLADLRQESNNIINKYNGWLTVWIMIISIVVGIIPIGLQYLIHKKSQKEVEKLLEDVEKKALSHQLSLMVSGVYIDGECSVVGDDVSRSELMNKLIFETNQLFGQLLNKIETTNGSIDMESEIYLLNCLVQYSRLVDIIRHNAKGRGVRDLDRIRDKVRNLVSAILRHEENSREQVWRRILDLRQELKELRWLGKE